MNRVGSRNKTLGRVEEKKNHIVSGGGGVVEGRGHREWGGVSRRKGTL